MLPSSGNVKKPTVCRYFAQNGQCIYGPDCKFLHSSSGAVTAAELGGGEMDKRFSSDAPPPHMAFRQQGGDYANGSADVGELQQFHYSQQRGNMMRGIANGPPPFGAPYGAEEHGISHGISQMGFARSSNRGPLPFFTPMNINPSANEFVPRVAQPPLAHGYSFPSIAGDHLAQARPAVGGLPFDAASYQTHSGTAMSPHGSPHLQRRSRSPMTAYENSQRGSVEEPATIQEYVGGTTYFYKPNEFDANHSHQTFPPYTMYSGVPAFIAHMKLRDNGQNSFFMPDDLKMEILSKQLDVLSVVDSHAAGLPEEVDNYRHLLSLESPTMKKPSTSLVYVTSCYKAINVKDGLTYCLRRVQGFKLTNTKCMNVIDNWKKMSHSNVVGFREVFTTKAFGDNSIIFVYDYHPKATTLLHKHFNGDTSVSANGFSAPSMRSFGGGAALASQRPAAAAAGGNFLPENLIWSYVVQLSNALRTIHAAGLAYQLVDLSKILLTDKSRLRLNCVGVKDVLTTQTSSASQPNIAQLQQQDLTAFGKLVLALACNSLTAAQPDQMKFSMEIIARTYSVDLQNLIMCMLGQRLHSINDIMPMIGARFYVQLDQAQMYCDVLDHELSKEVECGRLFRLMCKLGSVNERPEYAMDPAWSETGDRYMLKLYRDYLFHQVDEHGAPRIDLSHIVGSLNKLDAGTSEKVQLSSRDEQSVIIITYAELRRCFEAAFGELLQASRGASADDGQSKPTS